MNTFLSILHDFGTFLPIVACTLLIATSCFSLNNILKDAEFFALSEYRFDFLGSNDSWYITGKIPLKNGYQSQTPLTLCKMDGLLKVFFRTPDISSFIEKSFLHLLRLVRTLGVEQKQRKSQNTIKMLKKLFWGYNPKV